jgi:electron transfer flavoprotein beta subunit
MRIVVCVEQVYDPKTVKISRSREELDLREAVRILNPADKYALEAALRVREALGGEVVALTVGGADADDIAREAIAMGADRAVLLDAGGAVTGKGTAALIAAAIQRLGDVDLVLDSEPDELCGGSATGPRLAVALGWQLVLDAVQLYETSGGLSALVSYNGGGTEVFVSTPAVVVVTRGAERPRYPHPARIANAWNEGLVEAWTADELGLDETALTPDMELGGLVLGPERERGQVLKGTPAEAAAALAGVLRTRRLI